MSHIPLFKLAGSRGDGRLPYLNRQGVFLGEEVALLEIDRLGRWRPRPQAVLEKLFSLGYGVEVDMGWRMSRLVKVAQAFDRGDLGLAAIALVQTKLPALSDPILAERMAKADELEKYNQDQPRVPAGDSDGGQWIVDDGQDDATDLDSTNPKLILASDRLDPTQEKKDRFIEAHLDDSRKVAAKLGVPVENILGLAALEGGWGLSRFAIDGNNFFGIYYPAPLAIARLPAKKNSRVSLARFASYADGLQSFALKYGSLVRSKTDPTAFAAALQDSGKFGIDPTTGHKVTSYVPQVAATIRHIRSVLAGRFA